MHFVFKHAIIVVWRRMTMPRWLCCDVNNNAWSMATSSFLRLQLWVYSLHACFYAISATAHATDFLFRFHLSFKYENYKLPSRLLPDWPFIFFCISCWQNMSVCLSRNYYIKSGISRAVLFDQVNINGFWPCHRQISSENNNHNEKR